MKTEVYLTTYNTLTVIMQAYDIHTGDQQLLREPYE